ncbi:MAG TPA: DinB family protein [Tepidiformaceae bacterium]|nr:DinB family protein [Tepidiformaceae bacterium]
MELEVRLLAERASVRRISLLGLLEVIPPDFWPRREPGEEWTARNHLEHVATADALLRETIDAVVRQADLEVSYIERRAQLMDAAAGVSLLELRDRMETERAATIASLAGVDALLLDELILIPGSVDSFGQGVALPLRTVVTAWAEHDTGHEIAIRTAITTHPDAASLAAAARFRR